MKNLKTTLNLSRRGRVPSSKWSAAFQIIVPAVRRFWYFALVFALLAPALSFAECTAISPDECLSVVNDTADELFRLQSCIDDLKLTLNDISSSFNGLHSDWDFFTSELTFYDYQISAKDDINLGIDDIYLSLLNDFIPRLRDIISLYYHIDIFSYDGPAYLDMIIDQIAYNAYDITSQNVWEILSKINNALNSLANPLYGQFYDIEDLIISSTNTINGQRFDVYNALTWVTSIDCSSCGECTEGGDGSTNGYCCATCPCKETLEEILSVARSQLAKLTSADNHLNDIKTKLDNLKTLLTEWKDKFLEFKQETKEALGVISNSVYRIDVYVNDDLKEAMEILTNNVIKLKKDLSEIKPFYPHFSNELIKVNTALSKADYLFESFSNTIGNADIDGGLVNKVEDVFNGEMGFNEGSYSELSWWSRVELLLAKIAGVGSTNSLDEVNSSAISNSVSSLSSLDTSSLSSSFDTVGESVVSVVSSFKGLFSSPSLPEDGLTFLPVEIFQNVGNSSEGGSSVWESFGSINLKIPDEVIEPCRVVTSTIWTGSLLVSLYLLFVNYWGVASSYIVTFFKYLISILS